MFINTSRGYRATIYIYVCDSGGVCNLHGGGGMQLTCGCMQLECGPGLGGCTSKRFLEWRWEMLYEGYDFPEHYRRTL